MSETYSFKIYNGEEIRRFSTKSTSTNQDVFKGLVDYIKEAFGQNLVPAWKDEDGDMIRITTVLDMDEALQRHKDSEMKLYIVQGAKSGETEKQDTVVEENPSVTTTSEPIIDQPTIIEDKSTDNTNEQPEKKTTVEKDSDDEDYYEYFYNHSEFEARVKKQRETYMAKKAALQKELREKFGQPEVKVGCGMGQECPLKKREVVKGQQVDMTPEPGRIYKAMQTFNKSMVERKNKAKKGTKFTYLMGHLTYCGYEKFDNFLAQMAPTVSPAIGPEPHYHFVAEDEEEEEDDKESDVGSDIVKVTQDGTEEITDAAEDTAENQKPKVDPRLKDYLLVQNLNPKYFDEAIEKCGEDARKCVDFIRKKERTELRKLLESLHC